MAVDEFCLQQFIESIKFKGAGVQKDIHKNYGEKGIHYVGGYTQAHLTLWIRRMVGMLQLKK